jgi:uncharacterized protein (DUF934 family)
MNTTLRFVSTAEHATSATNGQVLTISNDADPRDLPLAGVSRIDLHFPKFTDGRAYSQAFLLRRRIGFAGELRATGDVLVDQVVQMQRCGFSSAVLRADQDRDVAKQQFKHFDSFYQGDALSTAQ